MLDEAANMLLEHLKKNPELREEWLSALSDRIAQGATIQELQRIWHRILEILDAELVAPDFGPLTP